MPVYNASAQWMRHAVESLQAQYYSRWELCAVDDGSENYESTLLLKGFAESDARIKVQRLEENRGISYASNIALKMAKGSFIALLDHDDEITPDALFRRVEAINKYPQADFLYSDECKVDDKASKRLFDFVFKPDWSPEFTFNNMFIGHLSVYCKAKVEALGGFRSQYDFSQDYDLALRMAEVAQCIVHVERVLYLWRATAESSVGGNKDYARIPNIAALKNALERQNILNSEVLALPDANCVRLSVPAETTKVSIVIPSDSIKNLRLVFDAVQKNTTYPNYEVIVVCNSSLISLLREEFFDWSRLKVLSYDKQYNFSDKCNKGVLSQN